MTDNGETVVLTEFYKAVGIVPEETVFFRMNLLPFHTVFCHNRVKVILNDVCFIRRPVPYLVNIHGRSDQEVTSQYIFKSLGISGRSWQYTCYSEHTCQQKYYISFHFYIKLFQLNVFLFPYLSCRLHHQ